VCVRISGGKTAGRDDRLLPHLRGETESALLEENFECEPRQLSANDSELLMSSFASLVTAESCGGYASIWPRRGSD
jgi:hypothetical protein